MQRLAQRAGIGGERAFHPQRWLVAEIAIERHFQWRPGKPELESRTVADERRHEVGQAQRRVDRLAMPDEPTGGREATRDRWPSQREFHLREPLDYLAALVVQHHGTVRDP